jgi:prepilin-type N-terminal cleavage/methylation domain-containing protein
MKNQRHAHDGLTLIEILVVIAIIGTLASVALPSLREARDKAQVANAVMEISALKTTFFTLFDDTGYYPNGDVSLCRTSLPSNNEVDLSGANAGLTANGATWGNWHGPYLTDVVDPWGNPYYLDEDYQCMAATEGCKGVDDASTDSSVIVSCGKNGALNNGSCAYDTDNVVYRLCD